jgi:hypothetical protein
LVVRKTKSVDLGGTGERDGFTLKVTGCECRTADFEMAFRKFALEWIEQANARGSDVRMIGSSAEKPCGCQDNA